MGKAAPAALRNELQQEVGQGVNALFRGAPIKCSEMLKYTEINSRQRLLLYQIAL